MDNHSTTRTDPRVVEAMLPYFTEDYGNASSATHSYGWRTAEAVELAREQVAHGLGAEDPRDIVFTSGATESNNLAIQGVVRALAKPAGQFVTQATEHSSVLEVARGLAKQGVAVKILPVDREGIVSLDALREALETPTCLVSIMMANNEIGSLQPIEAIGALCGERGVLFHCDAAQGVGKLPLNLGALPVDLLSFSGHKLYGPKGVGALYLRTRRPRIRLAPLCFGGPQERGLRPGTIAIPLVVGLARATALCLEERESEAKRLGALRDGLWSALRAQLDDVSLNGCEKNRLPGNLNVSFGGVDGAKLIVALKGVAVSSGSACTSGSGEASHVLRALGLPDALAKSSLRFGLGRFTELEEVERVAALVVEAVHLLRS